MSLIEQLVIENEAETAVVFQGQQYSYAQLSKDVAELSNWFVSHSVKSACINMPNSYDWVVIDLACQEARIVCTPVPQFFSEQQINHLIAQTQPDIIFGNGMCSSEGFETASPLGISAYLHKTTVAPNIPINTNKITFTSGSTGQPKGVCLSIDNQLKVATSLVDAIGVQQPKHLVLLPYATLLENIAGIYAPLLANGRVIIPNDNEKGFIGSRLTDVNRLLQCILIHEPHTMILVPELLQVLIAACKNGWQAPSSLTFVAVGGAKVDASLVALARQYNLPVFQGYGLSECASVVSICTNTNEPLHSVGKVLEHAQVKVIDGELIVYGNCFLGYLNQSDSWYPESVNTGDIVFIEDDYVFINGRSKNIIINSFGRNISPEWVESKLASTGMFAQTLIVGDAKPHLCALLVPISEQISFEAIEEAINRVNIDLPDYANVRTYFVLSEALTLANGLVTENGKLKRSAIETHYHKQINQQYLQQSSIAV